MKYLAFFLAFCFTGHVAAQGDQTANPFGHLDSSSRMPKTVAERAGQSSLVREVGNCVEPKSGRSTIIMAETMRLKGLRKDRPWRDALRRIVPAPAVVVNLVSDGNGLSKMDSIFQSLDLIRDQTDQSLRLVGAIDDKDPNSTSIAKRINLELSSKKKTYTSFQGTLVLECTLTDPTLIGFEQDKP